MTLNEFLLLTKDGLNLIAKKTEKAILERVTLPSYYRKLGVEIFSSPYLNDKFTEQRAELDRCITEQRNLRKSNSETEGLKEKLKAAANSAKNAVIAKKYARIANRTYLEIGRLAFENSRDDLNELPNTQAIAKHLHHLSSIVKEIELLKGKRADKLVNPKTIAYGCATVASLFACLVFYSLLLSVWPKRESTSIAAQNLPPNAHPEITAPAAANSRAGKAVDLRIKELENALSRSSAELENEKKNVEALKDSLESRIAELEAKRSSSGMGGLVPDG